MHSGREISILQKFKRMALFTSIAVSLQLTARHSGRKNTFLQQFKIISLFTGIAVNLLLTAKHHGKKTVRRNGGMKRF